MNATLKVSLSHSIYFELQILISLLCLIWLMVNRAIQSSPQSFMALIKCTETASSGQPLPLLAGQGGREQSFNPAFHTDSVLLHPLGSHWCGLEQMHSLRGAKELFQQLPGSCLPPQAQHFLRQLFLSRGFPPARRDLLFGIWTLFCWRHLSHWRWCSKYVLASLPRGFPSFGAVLQLGPCWTGTCS